MITSNVDVYKLAEFLDIAALMDQRLESVMVTPDGVVEGVVEVTVSNDLSVADAVSITAEIIGYAMPGAVSSDGNVFRLHFDDLGTMDGLLNLIEA